MDNLETLIAKQILQTSNQQEKAELDSWRKASKDNEEFYILVESYFNQTKKASNPSKTLFRDFLKIQEIVQETVAEKSSIENSVSTNKNIVFRKTWFWLSAACISLVLLFFGRYYIDNLLYQEKVVAEVSEINWQTKTVPNGQKLSLTLWDGTVVKVNSGSTISFPEEFSDSLREVHLEGEAFFEVNRDTLRPFIIKSGNVETVVLGTSFNVNAYPNQEQIKVAVAEGKVKVMGSGEADGEVAEVIITKDEMATYNIAHNGMQASKFQWDVELGWTEKRLVFKNAAFNEVLDRVERWYGVKFNVKGKPSTTRDYNADFEGQTLKSVLESLSYAFEFDYKIDRKELFVTFK